MSYFTGSIFSECLQMDTQLSIIFPSVENGNIKPTKVLYLLHGIKGNATSWLRKTSVERYAQQKGFTVIMPEVQRSFYQDLKYGVKYFEYISQELPRLCQQMFNISSKKKDTFIAGLSMGGYGAFNVAFTYYKMFAGCASFSGALDLENLKNATVESEDQSLINELIGAFGEDIEVPSYSKLDILADNMAQLESQDNDIPKIFITCGKQDYLYSHSKMMKNHLDSLGINCNYMEWDGDHNWEFWDKSIQLAMDFFNNDEIPQII